jgi:hypothetical protein
MALTYNFVVPGGRPYDLWDVLLPLSFLLITLISSIGITWMFYQPGRRGLWRTFVLVSVAIMVGAVLTSVAIWRQHWIELVREMFRSIDG